jgi:hypothetical protein
MNPRPVCFLFTLLFGIGACDRRPAIPTTLPARAVVLELELKPLSPLLPNRPTHAAADALGNVYWVQEEPDRGDDTLFVIGEGDIPRATELSAGNIGAALGATTDARGNIQAIATVPGGDIYFFFLGTQGRRSLACLGIFTPKTSGIRVLANFDEIAAATGMGQSLTLARASIVSDARNVWIWIRHSDASAVFRIDPRGLPREGAIKLTKTFESARLEGQPLPLTREEYEISIAPDGAIFLLDLFAGRILKIKPDGSGTVVRSVVNLPTSLSTPTTDRAGHLLLFAGNSDKLIPPKTVEDAGQLKLDTTYPAMLIFDLSSPERKVTTIERDNIVAYPGFPVFKMKLDQLVPHPREEAWISYDSGSGELLRLKIREKTY